MKKISILFIILILTACSTSPQIKKDKVTLEKNQWEPINNNYMNKKDF